MGALLAFVLMCWQLIGWNVGCSSVYQVKAKECPQQSGHMVEVAIVTTNSTCAGLALLVCCDACCRRAHGKCTNVQHALGLSSK